MQFYEPGTHDLSTEIKVMSDYDSRHRALLRQRAALEGKTDEASKQALQRLERLDTIGAPDFDAVLLPDTGQTLRVAAASLASYDANQPAGRLIAIGRASCRDRVCQYV